jgi:hypothetical protein
MLYYLGKGKVVQNIKNVKYVMFCVFVPIEGP